MIIGADGDRVGRGVLDCGGSALVGGEGLEAIGRSSGIMSMGCDGDVDRD